MQEIKFKFLTLFLRQFLFTFLLVEASTSLAFEASIFHSQSSSTRSNRIHVSEKLMQIHKLSLMYSESIDTTGQLTDPRAYSSKLSYRYRISEDLNISIDAKTFNDYYNYNGTGFSFKSSYKVFSIDFRENDKLSSLISIKVEQQNKNYSKLAREQILMRNFSFRFDQDLRV